MKSINRHDSFSWDSENDKTAQKEVSYPKKSHMGKKYINYNEKTISEIKP